NRIQFPPCRALATACHRQSCLPTRARYLSLERRPRIDNTPPQSIASPAATQPGVSPVSAGRSQIGEKTGLDGADALFIAPVERPLPDPLRHHKAGLNQHPHVLAEGRLA